MIYIYINRIIAKHLVTSLLILGEISIIDAKLKKTEMFSYRDEEMDQSSSHLRNTPIQNKVYHLIKFRSRLPKMKIFMTLSSPLKYIKF